AIAMIAAASLSLAAYGSHGDETKAAGATNAVASATPLPHLIRFSPRERPIRTIFLMPWSAA
ncbi:hypothetical protein DNP20_24660, partial [Salmonella enterica subsp. enterica serovar Panama]